MWNKIAICMMTVLGVQLTALAATLIPSNDLAYPGGELRTASWVSEGTPVSYQFQVINEKGSVVLNRVITHPTTSTTFTTPRTGHYVVQIRATYPGGVVSPWCVSTNPACNRVGGASVGIRLYQYVASATGLE